MIQYDLCAGEKTQAATGWWDTLHTLSLLTHTQTNTLILMLRPFSVTEGYLIKFREGRKTFYFSLSQY